LLAERLHCVRCNYALVGLARTALCPECGFPIADSLHDALIACAPAAYRQRVLSGAELIGMSCKCLFASPLLGILIFISPELAIFAVPLVLIVILCALWFGASRFVAFAPVTLLRSARARKHAHVARWTPLALIVLALISFGASAAGLLPVFVTPIIIAACIACWCWALLAYAAALAERLPAAHLVTRALDLRLLAVAPLVCIVLSAVLLHVSPRTMRTFSILWVLAPPACLWLLCLFASTWTTDFIERLLDQSPRDVPTEKPHESH
jgi:hypothetical protein